MMPTASRAESTSPSPRVRAVGAGVAGSTQGDMEVLPQVPTGGDMQEAPISNLPG